jgi:hypothetical protein
MAHFADKLHVDKQIIDRVESAVLLSLIGGGTSASAGIFSSIKRDQPALRVL